MALYVPRPPVLQAGTHDCYLKFVSASEIRLMPYGGDQILVNGTRHTIPAAGVALASNPGWAGYQCLYVRAVADPVLRIDAADPAAGTAINSDGMLTCGGWPVVGLFSQNGGSVFQNQFNICGVISYYNRRKRVVWQSSSTSGGQTASQHLGNFGCACMAFAGDHLRLDVSGYQTNTTAGISTITSLKAGLFPSMTGVVNTNAVDAISYHHVANWAQNVGLHGGYTVPAAGSYVLMIYAHVNGGGASWFLNTGISFEG